MSDPTPPRPSTPTPKGTTIATSPSSPSSAALQLPSTPKSKALASPTTFNPTEKATTMPPAGSGSGPPGLSPQGQQKQVRSPVAGATTGNATSVGASTGGGFLPGITLSKPTTTTATTTTTTTTTTGTGTTGTTVGSTHPHLGSPSPSTLNSGAVGNGSPSKPQSQSQARGPLSKKLGKKASSSHPEDHSHSHPSNEKAHTHDHGNKDVQKEKERDPTRQGKGKDLSHVPCRFYKMGACAAGEGCVFSHNLSGGGEGAGNTKQVCQWFLKGNCRFGHKCALAHLYPNEPPTMDRKHKKAAQLAANGVPQEEIESVVYGGTSYILPAGGYQQEEAKQEDENEVTGGMDLPVDKTTSTNGGKMSYSQSLKSPNNAKSASGANKADASLDSHMADSAARARRGSSTVDRTGAVPIKSIRSQAQRQDAAGGMIGSISPANRHQAALLSTLNRPGSATAQAAHSPSTPPTLGYNPSMSSSIPRSQGTLMARGPGDESENFKSRPVPLSVPGPLPMSARSGSFVQDPIGTPPRESTSFILGRSFGAGGSTNPLTAPLLNRDGSFSSTDPVNMRPGLKTTGFADSNSVNMPPGSVPGSKFSSSVLGAEFNQMGRDIWGQRTSLAPVPSRTHSTQSQSGMTRPILDTSNRRESEVFMLDDADDEDADAEEFLPGSLTELLNPRERARRLSRRESGSGPGVTSGSVGIRAGWVSSSGNGAGGDTNTLGGIGSTGSSWDSRPNMDALLHRQAMSAGAVDGGFLRSLWDDAGEDARRKVRQQDLDAPPASAAAAVGGLSSMFAGAGGSNEGYLTAPPDTGFQLGPSNSSVAFLPTFTAHRQAILGDHGSPATRGNLHSPSRPSPLHRDSTNQAISSSNVPVKDGLEVQHAHLAPPHLRPLASPGTRALEAHAPGQSLPQGLAAGLSRMHLRPSTSRQSSGLNNNNTGTHSGLSGGEALSPSGSSMGVAGPQAIGRYETLRRQESREKPVVPQVAVAPAGEGEDDDLFEMEG
ncbi:hypothetical protein HD553DRAFT_318189 [Filobasidium floriforme]|uniref:uncharacterized protein n=1 Tax=Filobasidium floriforme TaxID=5210 RepID=UPI001E8D3479|nr:uncharacterized protein HD553DRAFT_318189 [Filobasidium floriforme]KAH8079623.1 hypothetical protein HD553DRAFT_318189 [Filobasidium floriforme]